MALPIDEIENEKKEQVLAGRRAFTSAHSELDVLKRLPGGDAL